MPTFEDESEFPSADPNKKRGISLRFADKTFHFLYIHTLANDFGGILFGI
ncbi:hypothetical protein LEP1GSC060_0236 [Leptospira weilii serovar Ranarum str. ICFT]|uniref:Uncharacterized protein n=1 Tax=Leptospira weilii serovar Ranarum str. ICFT TaxID=1218598 RepID=N1WKP0_9LEPT|nr:hypothetical protein LEP1GSC060_0236 [Leptospira weilii serovar Ranarum str. ICFT]